jgi:hypothetical protein
MRFSFVLAAALVCGWPSIASAQVQVPSRGWFDVNVVGINPHQGPQQSTTIGVSASGLPAMIDATIPELSNALGAGAEAGFNFARGRGIGIGVRYEEARWEYSSPIVVVASDPAFLFGTATASDVTGDDLERRERTIDVSLQWAAPLNQRITIRMFAGPTLHVVDQDMVSSVAFAPTFDASGNINGVAITGHERQQVQASTAGFHVGGDVSVFFSRHIGVGVGVRRHHATVDITDPLSGQPAELSLSRFTISTGLRLRF